MLIMPIPMAIVCKRANLTETTPSLPLFSDEFLRYASKTISVARTNFNLAREDYTLFKHINFNQTQRTFQALSRSILKPISPSFPIMSYVEDDPWPPAAPDTLRDEVATNETLGHPCHLIIVHHHQLYKTKDGKKVHKMGGKDSTPTKPPPGAVRSRPMAKCS